MPPLPSRVEGWFDRIWGALATGTILVLVALAGRDGRFIMVMALIVAIVSLYVGLRALVLWIAKRNLRKWIDDLSFRL